MLSNKMKNSIFKILKWSETYTKTDMTYLVKGGLSLTSGQFSSSLITLVSAIIISRILPKEIYGNYKYILSLVEIASILTLTGLGTALVRSVAQGQEGTLKEFYKLNLFWSILPAAALTIASIYYYLQGNQLLSFSLLAGGLTLPFIDSAELYKAFLNGKKLFKFMSLAQFLRTLFSTSIVLLVAFLTGDPVYMAIAFFTSHLIIVNFLYYFTLYKFKPNNSIDKDAKNLGKHTTFINLFAIISDQLDNVLVFHYLGATPLAIYNFASAIPQTMQGFIKQLGFLATPKFAENTSNSNTEKTKKTLLRKTFVLFLATIPIVVFYWLAAPYIFKILFPDYMDSVFYSQIYTLSLLINSSIAIAFLDAHKAIKEKYILSIISNSLKIPLMILGTIYYSIPGLIFTIIIAKIIGYTTSLSLALNLKLK